LKSYGQDAVYGCSILFFVWLRFDIRMNVLTAKQITLMEDRANNVFHKWFVFSAGFVLLLTGVAKVWSAFGSARILQNSDPILGLQFNHLMFVTGALEMVAAYLCLFSKFCHLALILVAWLATNFVFYRLGLLWVGYHKPCPCLGNFTDALHISPQTADTAMKIILAYLLIGSYSALFWLWRQKRWASPPTPPPEAPVSTA
jgi:uncharacterized membrane protein